MCKLTLCECLSHGMFVNKKDTRKVNIICINKNTPGLNLIIRENRKHQSLTQACIFMVDTISMRTFQKHLHVIMQLSCSLLGDKFCNAISDDKITTKVV